MNSLMIIMMIFSWILSITLSYSYYHYKRSNIYNYKRQSKTIIMNNNIENSIDLKNFLDGTIPWKGRKDILGRKKQLPNPEYSPQQVVQIVLDALQINDDPQLDHGSCVLLAFTSPTGPIAESNLDPSGYGRFLRSSKYGILLDHGNAKLINEPIQLQDSLSVKQRVDVTGYIDNTTIDNKNKITLSFDFYLTKVIDVWLIDVIILVTNNS